MQAKKKLVLSKETLRTLQSKELDSAVGGVPLMTLFNCLGWITDTLMIAAHGSNLLCGSGFQSCGPDICEPGGSAMCG